MGAKNVRGGNGWLIPQLFRGSVPPMAIDATPSVLANSHLSLSVVRDRFIVPFLHYNTGKRRWT